VFKKGSALVPSWLAFAVIALLEKHFGELIDYDFTAEMEEDLDRIANGEADRAQWLHDFYFGAGDELGGLRALVEDLGEIDARDVNSIPIGSDIVLRVGRYGPYVERGDERASVPEEMAPDELTVEKAEELLAAPSGERELGTDPSSGLPVVAKVGRYGPYVTEVLADDAPKTAKPRTGSLFKSMSLDTVTLDDALRLLSLPRVVGTDASGEEITAQNGRYGPYLKKGTDSRSIDSEEQLFEITVDEALAIYAQPKQRGGRAAAAPLRELGADPTSGQPVVVKEGRFGAYVTDGDTNATLRKGDSVESVTIERASELLAEKRAKGPATKRGRTTKKTAKKTTKKAAKKAVTKTAKK
jgi:DNA topoisomerase I